MGMYEIQLWFCENQSNCKIMQLSQNKFLRMIISAHRYKTIHTDSESR